MIFTITNFLNYYSEMDIHISIIIAIVIAIYSILFLSFSDHLLENNILLISFAILIFVDLCIMIFITYSLSNKKKDDFEITKPTETSSSPTLELTQKPQETVAPPQQQTENALPNNLYDIKTYKSTLSSIKSLKTI